MKITEGPLPGLIIIEPNILQDDRGYFFEMYHKNRYTEYGMPDFVQTNISRSKQNVLRGLHYQLPHPQGKLVGVTRGTVWDVAVDLRQQSPTFGKWFSITLSDDNHKQMYIPAGFAHGFCVLSETADFYYHCTDVYQPHCEHGIAWNDPHLNISWPIKNPLLSEKDKTFLSLHEMSHENLFA